MQHEPSEHSETETPQDELPWVSPAVADNLPAGSAPPPILSPLTLSAASRRSKGDHAPHSGGARGEDGEEEEGGARALVAGRLQLGTDTEDDDGEEGSPEGNTVPAGLALDDAATAAGSPTAATAAATPRQRASIIILDSVRPMEEAELHPLAAAAGTGAGAAAASQEADTDESSPPQQQQQNQRQDEEEREGVVAPAPQDETNVYGGAQVVPVADHQQQQQRRQVQLYGDDAGGSASVSRARSGRSGRSRSPRAPLYHEELPPTAVAAVGYSPERAGDAVSPSRQRSRSAPLLVSANSRAASPHSNTNAAGSNGNNNGGGAPAADGSSYSALAVARQRRQARMVAQRHRQRVEAWEALLRRVEGYCDAEAAAAEEKAPTRGNKPVAEAQRRRPPQPPTRADRARVEQALVDTEAYLDELTAAADAAREQHRALAVGADGSSEAEAAAAAQRQLLALQDFHIEAALLHQRELHLLSIPPPPYGAMTSGGRARSRSASSNGGGSARRGGSVEKEHTWCVRTRTARAYHSGSEPSSARRRRDSQQYGGEYDPDTDTTTLRRLPWVPPGAGNSMRAATPRSRSSSAVRSNDPSRRNSPRRRASVGGGRGARSESPASVRLLAAPGSPSHSGNNNNNNGGGGATPRQSTSRQATPRGNSQQQQQQRSGASPSSSPQAARPNSSSSSVAGGGGVARGPREGISPSSRASAPPAGGRATDADAAAELAALTAAYEAAEPETLDRSRLPPIKAAFIRAHGEREGLAGYCAWVSRVTVQIRERSRS